MKQYYHAVTDTYMTYGQPFTLDGISYPANWLEHASAAEVAALGLVEVTVTGVPQDERYYVNAETLANGVKTIAAVAKPKADIVALRGQEILAERDRRTQNGGYLAAGKWFHSDTFSRTQQLGLVMLGANIPADTQWKTMDGTFVTMTPTLANQIFLAAAASDIAIFAAAKTHLANLNASATPETYSFLTGWPKIYGES